LSFPEIGEADQTSVELQLNGDFGTFDFVSGLYWFRETGSNLQQGYSFLNFNRADGLFFLDQEVTSAAIFGNLGWNITDQFRLAGGLRYNRDEKDAIANVGIGPTPGNRSWNEVSWDISANFSMNNGLNLYGAVQSGYQQGQFPARPFCLFGDPGCFVAGDNITALNYEVGIKGQVMDNLQISAAVFYTDYSDLPYQVSTTDPAGGGFNTVNLIVNQRSTGFEWENTMYITENFLFRLALGYIDVDVDQQGGVKPVAPLTPELTAAFSPEWRVRLSGGGSLLLRADYSYRDAMWGEPSSDPGRLTRIDSRSILNFDFAYEGQDGTWVVALYGYILRILSNDASEFGLRFSKDFSF
jgi:iron complex outermembrane receptor protein